MPKTLQDEYREMTRYEYLTIRTLFDSPLSPKEMEQGKWEVFKMYSFQVVYRRESKRAK